MFNRRLLVPYLRPSAVLLAVILILAVIDGSHGRFLSSSIVFSVLQMFATVGPIALGVGMTMIIREFDLSVAGMVGMAGCIAVLTGGDNPWLGLAAAVGTGLCTGLLQGFIIARLKLPSIGVTLGGLLVFLGVSYALTGSRSIQYDDLEVAGLLGQHIFGFFSIPSLIILVIFAVVALIFGMTKLGRDLLAVGGDRRAALSAGIRVDTLLIGTFAFSGALAAMCGALLGYSLASAAPTGLSNVLVPATTAAILGGVSLSGGTGRPLGIALGTLTLSVLQSGLNALGLSSYAHEIFVGLVLLAIAILDGTAFNARLDMLRLALRRS
ncbi:ribose/xylose/arabinose/galactoside ABC-type transport system permease subunit [Rhodopseudomonas rhenobacensis]|uniref:Ribose/xylose/arabinose/galactoside ABC-type transport system permease subunit n=1 Tax=Rhodopseudomonas rhenobacensis TaxID=87461 RepID=A0A7W7Z6N4_9BRAD|nr:ABC transporter permease [Rhodopseudomonas rhenobacensis]MBB5048998.1 ribose/xylose/arabinose/galactoside ABC-type transport system permease subunit [Rhodopseudomonas rhenobacensis]